MEKIIVTTDLSPNSKAGMRFAIQLAQARQAELIFLHVFQVLRASFWSDRKYAYYVDRTRDAVMSELPQFVKRVYRSMKIIPTNYQVVAHHNLDVESGIMEYAKRQHADYICISTRGAGTFSKIYGTTTSAIIAKSPTPILCIPSSYRAKPITSILYASDLTAYEQELPRVVAFAKPLNASVELLHFSWPYEFMLDANLVERTLEEKTGYKISLHYHRRDIEKSLMKEIESAIMRSKPSILVMFTNQQRSFFQRLFLSSNAKDYSYHPKIPMLSFNKIVKEKSQSTPQTNAGAADKAAITATQG